jgi:hypothetical protein
VKRQAVSKLHSFTTERAVLFDYCLEDPGFEDFHEYFTFHFYTTL